MNPVRKIWALLVAVPILLMTSCDSCKTPPNTSDTTPPTIDWTVKNNTTGVETKFTGNATMTAHLGESLTVTGCANDDGGLKEITSFSNSGWSCISGDLAQQVGPGLVVPQTSQLGLDDKGLAWKRFCLFFSTTLNFTCSQGFHFNAGTATFTISAKNFGNLDASATLSVNVEP